MVTGLAHAGISTRDMEKSVIFYTEIMGGTIILKIEEPKGTPWIQLVQFPDRSCVELFYPRPEQFPLGTQLGRNHLAFRVDDIHALHQKLLDHQVPVTTAPRIARDGNWQMWCTDPNGYPVEIMQYTEGCPQLGYGPCKTMY